MTSLHPKIPRPPEFTVNKNKTGYEIRLDVLTMAKDLVQQEYNVKFAGWQLSAEKDEKTGQVVTKIDMPEFPGLSTILSTAEMLYGFVNHDKNDKK